MANSIFFTGFPEVPWQDMPMKPVEAMESDLEVALDAQRSLMVECGVANIPTDIAFSLTIQSLVTEAMEAGVDFPNLSKPWKKNLEVDLEALKMEWIDVFHYWLQGCWLLGMDANEVNMLYHQKNRENFNRIQEKLKGAKTI